MYIKLLIPFLIGGTIWFLPIPESLDPKAWHLFAIFVSTIAGIVLKPLPMGVIALFSVLVAVLTKTLDLGHQALSGYSSPVIWLVVYVFFIARGFINSKLGLRIAYLFVRMLGKYSLGLG